MIRSITRAMATLVVLAPMSCTTSSAPSLGDFSQISTQAWSNAWAVIPGAPALVGQPSLSSWSSSRLQVWARQAGTPSFIATAASDNGGANWSGWSTGFGPPGGVIGDPVAVSRQYGDVDVVVQGSNTDLYYNHWSGSSFSWLPNWVDLGCAGCTRPALNTWRNDRLDLWAVSGTSLVHNLIADTGTTWSGWPAGGSLTLPAGTIQGGPTAVSRGWGLIDIAVATDKVYVTSYSEKAFAWAPWSAWATSPGSGDVLTTPAPYRTDVFSSGNLGGYTTTQHASREAFGAVYGWDQSTSQSGSSTAPGAVSRSVGVTDMVRIRNGVPEFAQWKDPTLAAPTIPRGDTTQTTSPPTGPTAAWETTSVVVPPGKNSSCPGGRVLVSGTNGSKGLFYYDMTFSLTNTIDVGPSSSVFHYGAGTPDPNSGLQSYPSDHTYDDYVENDNQLMRSNVTGEILLVRGLTTRRAGATTWRSGTGVWASTDCGNTWKMRSFIDPGVIFSGTYGTPQGAGGCSVQGHACGGFDREEAYVDPWDGRVYITVGAQGAGNPDMLLFVSSDSSATSFSAYKIDSNVIAQPIRITSVHDASGSRPYFVDCYAGTPRLRWFDGSSMQPPANGTISTAATGAAVRWDDGTHSASPATDCQGSATPIRVGRFNNLPSNGSAGVMDVIRVDSPTWNGSAGVHRTVLASIGPNGDVSVKNDFAFGGGEGGVSGSVAYNATWIESNAPGNTNSEAFVYYEENNSGTQYGVRGRAVRTDIYSGYVRWSPPIAISNGTWSGGGINGDYLKGAWYTSTGNPTPYGTHFLVQWTPSDTGFIHLADISVP